MKFNNSFTSYSPTSNGSYKFWLPLLVSLSLMKSTLQAQHSERNDPSVSISDTLRSNEIKDTITHIPKDKAYTIQCDSADIQILKSYPGISDMDSVMNSTLNRYLTASGGIKDLSLYECNNEVYIISCEGYLCMVDKRILPTITIKEISDTYTILLAGYPYSFLRKNRVEIDKEHTAEKTTMWLINEKDMPFIDNILSYTGGGSPTGKTIVYALQNDKILCLNPDDSIHQIVPITFDIDKVLSFSMKRGCFQINYTDRDGEEFQIIMDIHGEILYKAPYKERIHIHHTSIDNKPGLVLEFGYSADRIVFMQGNNNTIYNLSLLHNNYVWQKEKVYLLEDNLSQNNTAHLPDYICAVQKIGAIIDIDESGLVIGTEGFGYIDKNTKQFSCLMTCDIVGPINYISYENSLLLFTDAHNVLYSFDNQKKIIKPLREDSGERKTSYITTNKTDQYLLLSNGEEQYIYDYTTQAISPIAIPHTKDISGQSIDIIDPNHYTVIQHFINRQISITIYNKTHFKTVVGKESDNDFFNIDNTPLFIDLNYNLWHIDKYKGTTTLIGRSKTITDESKTRPFQLTQGNNTKILLERGYIVYDNCDRTISLTTLDNLPLTYAEGALIDSTMQEEMRALDLTMSDASIASYGRSPQFRKTIIRNRHLFKTSLELLNDKPVFLFTLPKSDRNGAFLIANLDILMEHYNIVLFTRSNSFDLRNIYQDALSKNINIPYREVGGHGAIDLIIPNAKIERSDLLRPHILYPTRYYIPSKSESKGLSLDKTTVFRNSCQGGKRVPEYLKNIIPFASNINSQELSTGLLLTPDSTGKINGIVLEGKIKTVPGAYYEEGEKK